MLKMRRHTGAALLAFIAILMLLMGAISTAAAHFVVMGQQLVSLQLDREIAFRAAEAALLDAESDLIAATVENGTRLAAWPAPGTCGEGPRLGLCRANGDRSVWQAWIDGGSADSVGIPLGTFTGAQLPALPDGVIGATTLPRYLPELRDDTPARTPDEWPTFRIVALGMGRDPNVRVVLQTEFQP